MSKMIQVRNVPDDVHKKLKARAAAEGISLSDFIKRDLEELAKQATLEEIGERARAHGPSGLRTETILSALREVRDD